MAFSKFRHNFFENHFKCKVEKLTAVNVMIPICKNLLHVPKKSYFNLYTLQVHAMIFLDLLRFGGKMFTLCAGVM